MSASLVLLLATGLGGAPEPAAPGAGTGPATRAPATVPVEALTLEPAAAALPTSTPETSPPPSGPSGQASPAPARRVLADPVARGRTPLPAEVFTGAGFDACSAPALETMRAWRDSSPYGALGVYVSGRQRACGQPRLTADWVRRVRAMGWRLLPTHVGLQAPCAPARQPSQRIDPDRAVQQGKEEAAEAVRALKRLGLAKGSPVYLDIEAYPRGDARCSGAVVDFALGWTQALHRAGFHAGLYSSTDSGVADLSAAARAGSSPLPDAVWYARWDGRATTTDGAGALGADLWSRQRRVHQHWGNVKETYGGHTLNIDRDQLDTLVAR
ncbi:DUF1906 domain-containing protein [Kitasatospora camelliae]|uniref:Glycoside hydrolase domain-containing protein n=1 Tax=Kitasatospora camelliae TaxID=3156397 RepID=A0AAU8JXH1_9ACTN